MLYTFLQFPARIALYFYCRSIRISPKESLKEKGPLILAANHPNSFLDAIIMASIFRQPIYSLARGDAFASGFITKILHKLNMLPVYRISEGLGNLENNYSTFDSVQTLLEKNKTVLIFSEGRCINEWHLRPLKKGTARIASTAWKSGIPLRVLPVGINYSNFRHFGKRVDILFGKTITSESFEETDAAKLMTEFNKVLKQELETTVYEIPIGDLDERKKIFAVTTSLFTKLLLFLPASIGYLLHAPIYFGIHWIIRNRANDHYDSIMTGALFLFYPLYILITVSVLLLLTKSLYPLLLILIMPLSALALLHIRKVV